MVATAARQVVRSLLPRAVLNWREAQYYGRHGEVELHLLEFLCRHDQDAIDVGANFGGYVHFMRRHARRVLAYEPMPDFVRLLQEKFPRDVVIDSTALSDRAGIAELRMPVIDGMMLSGCSTISPDAAATYPAHRTIEVRTDRLDNVYDGSAGFIKIDVEGHEQAVLDGAVDTIRRCLPRLLVELDEHLSPGSVAHAKAFFDELGYRGYFVHAGRLERIEQFSIVEMQKASDSPDLKSTLRDRPRFDNYINNFIFLPPGEPDETPHRISERLARL
jgi:FkbM family methyltransferase